MSSAQLSLSEDAERSKKAEYLARAKEYCRALRQSPAAKPNGACSRKCACVWYCDPDIHALLLADIRHPEQDWLKRDYLRRYSGENEDAPRFNDDYELASSTLDDVLMAMRKGTFDPATGCLHAYLATAIYNAKHQRWRKIHYLTANAIRSATNWRLRLIKSLDEQRSHSSGALQERLATWVQQLDELHPHSVYAHYGTWEKVVLNSDPPWDGILNDIREYAWQTLDIPKAVIMLGFYTEEARRPESDGVKVFRSQMKTLGAMREALLKAGEKEGVELIECWFEAVPRSVDQRESFDKFTKYMVGLRTRNEVLCRVIRSTLQKSRSR